MFQSRKIRTALTYVYNTLDSSYGPEDIIRFIGQVEYFVVVLQPQQLPLS